MYSFRILSKIFSLPGDLQTGNHGISTIEWTDCVRLQQAVCLRDGNRLTFIGKYNIGC